MMADMADRLTNLRNAAGLTQVELARDAKVTQQAISKLESGFHRKFPPLDTAFSLAKFYKVPKEYLLFGTAPMPQETQMLLKAWEQAPHDLKMQIMLMLWPK
jgi:transcriptional regulator with XRE-family HTH domain